MPSHRIHLKGPWDFSWSRLGGAIAPQQGTVTMPQDWQALFGTCSGKARFVRRFHCPTNLESHEQVVIVLTAVRGRGSASLNLLPLGEFDSHGESLEFEITGRLRSFNELAIELAYDPDAADGQPGGLYGVVAIEIRSPDE